VVRRALEALDAQLPGHGLAKDDLAALLGTGFP
jgi:hypothetical protein